ncbi:MAG: DUF2695 domain-containing protein [Planctomycetes bacterium]|nr:DUF2695 domain-containing protein [Planctomycetota bacterium]
MFHGGFCDCEILYNIYEILYIG